jgi:hypothetical protein
LDKRWQPLHCFTSCSAFFWAVGQQKPWRKALATKALEDAWCPHSPWCISLSISIPSSGSMHFWKIPDTLRLYSSLLMMVYAPTRR